MVVMGGSPAPVLVPCWRQELPSDVRGLASGGGRLVAHAGGRLLGFLPSGRRAWLREFEHLHDLSRIVSIAGSIYLETDAVERVDPRTGRTLKRRDLGPEISLGSDSGWLTCYSGASGRFHVLDPETLETLASCVDVSGRVSLHEGLLCQETDEPVLLMRDPWTGAELGRLATSPGAAHIHHGQSVCFFSASERFSIDLGSGRTVWRREVEADSAGAWLPLRHGDLAFVSGRGVSAYDLVTGELRWRALDQETALSPWRHSLEGRLVLKSESRVHVVDATTGRLVGSQDCGLSISTVVLAAGGLVAVLGVSEGGATVLHGLQAASTT